MRMILPLAAAGLLAGCATYGDYGDGAYRYEGSAWAARHGGSLRGPGADRLDPWLAETDEGQALVRAGWRGARRGWIDERTAHRANVWFRRHADVDRDLCLTDDEIRSALISGVRHLQYARR